MYFADLWLRKNWSIDKYVISKCNRNNDLIYLVVIKRSEHPNYTMKYTVINTNSEKLSMMGRLRSVQMAMLPSLEWPKDTVALGRKLQTLEQVHNITVYIKRGRFWIIMLCAACLVSLWTSLGRSQKRDKTEYEFLGKETGDPLQYFAKMGTHNEATSV